ncbi:MAG: ATP-binding region ATPase domain protein [Mucilaginibacter sp.]|nr:ATP-binding region ATPase domain protein [Mucilaginibacter sp.]
MKTITLAILFTVIYCVGFAQEITTKMPLDSLKHELAISKDDTGRVLILAKLCITAANLNLDSIAMYGKDGVVLAQKVNFTKGEWGVLYNWGRTLELRGEYPQSLELQFRGLQLAEKNHYRYETAASLFGIGTDYWGLQDYAKAVNYFKRAGQISKTIPHEPSVEDLNILIDINIGDSYSKMNRLDSAFFYLQRTYNATLKDRWHPALLLFFGDIQFKMGHYQTAFTYLHQSIVLNEKNNDLYTNTEACKTIARFFKEINQPDSSIFYAKKGLTNAQAIGYKLDVLENSKLLAGQYEYKDIRQAHYYLKLVMLVSDELYGAKKVKELQKILSAEQERQRKIEAERVAYQNQLKQYAFLTSLGILLLIAFILYRNNKQKQKANSLLQQQKEEIQSTLTQLKVTQTQLIQSEKMASLGELTAGIAHEIQNPLNFVNNFSEVNTELIDELKLEIVEGNYDEVNAIADDIKQNEQKINMHGKRADNIVKGMLQHSQSSSGKKEPVDINALSNEYLRLSYHGLRAKDKSFNAELVTHFDADLSKINVIPQDIGRVLLNLFNNAFYSVNQKKKTAGEDYKPEVSVSTGIENGQVVIKVKDNGAGIPDAIKDKIMQPFFTTKPTGEGTGLGLSLSYDIVVKGHGGSIAIETKEGEFTEFQILLPIQN